MYSQTLPTPCQLRDPKPRWQPVSGARGATFVFVVLCFADVWEGDSLYITHGTALLCPGTIPLPAGKQVGSIKDTEHFPLERSKALFGFGSPRTKKPNHILQWRRDGKSILGTHSPPFHSPHRTATPKTKWTIVVLF